MVVWSQREIDKGLEFLSDWQDSSGHLYKNAAGISGLFGYRDRDENKVNAEYTKILQSSPDEAAFIKTVFDAYNEQKQKGVVKEGQDINKFAQDLLWQHDPKAKGDKLEAYQATWESLGELPKPAHVTTQPDNPERDKTHRRQ